MEGMSSERRKEIGRLGGIAAQRSGKAHSFTSEEAKAAGRKGGVSVSRNREHMAKIGSLGGKSNKGKPRNARVSPTVFMADGNKAVQGDVVWWNDPDGGSCSGNKTITHMDMGTGVLTLDHGTEVYPSELEKART